MLKFRLMEDNYLTGLGFIGSRLALKLDKFSPIPHSEIKTFKLNSFDNFYFLSTYGNLYSQQEDSKIIQANLLDLVVILNQINFERGFKSFVYISTSSVRLKRQTMYSRSKKAAEEILLSYLEKYDVPICIIRPFSVTGVGEQKNHLIPKLIDSCLNGTRMDFVPKPVHDFIDVEDVVDGILNLSKHHAKGIFELGTGIGYTNDQVRKIVEKVTGYPANIDIVNQLREYDNEEWVSGNFRARMYGWLPKKSLEQSITEMVEEAKNELQTT